MISVEDQLSEIMNQTGKIIVRYYKPLVIGHIVNRINGPAGKAKYLFKVIRRATEEEWLVQQKILNDENYLLKGDYYYEVTTD